MLSARGTDYLAYGLLLLLAFGLCAWLWRTYRQTRYSLAQAPLLVFSHWICRVLWRLKVERQTDLNQLGGAIIICNHRSPFDPWFINVGLNRVIHWMVAREYCESPLFGALMRALRTIPTSRSGIDTAATRTAIRQAQQGELVGMLPEGRINVSQKLLMPGRPGAVLVALKARVPVVPCYICDPPFDGSILGNLFKPARVKLVIGRPLDLTEFYGREGEKEVLELLTRRFLTAIALLAGVRDFEPQLAGRRWKPGMEDGDADKSNP